MMPLIMLCLTQTAQPFDFASELSSYKTALISDAHVVGRSVGFMDLWVHCDENKGQRVQVSGRLAKSFHVEASSDLPARAELWIGQGENLICAVVREDLASSARLGQDVTVTGVSCGLVKYQSGDGPRLAPLVVGPGPIKLSIQVNESEPKGWSAVLIPVGFAAVMLVVALVRFWSKQPRGRYLQPGEPLEFIS